MSKLQDEQGNDSDIHSYSIIKKLGGIGRPVLMQVVHEMDDVHDIRQFVCSSRCAHDVMFDNLFPWSIAQGLAHSYSLHSIPIQLTDGVCF